MQKIIIVLLVLISSNTYLACSCVNPESSTFVENADTVFVGELKRKKWFFSLIDRKYQFTVNEAVKGQISKEITIFSDRSSSCRNNFKKNIEYLIIVHKDKELKNRTSLCSTWHLNSEIAKSILQRLKSPNK